MENKKQAKQTQLDKYYKSIINQDKCAVVICNLSHIIIDMNQAAIERYAKQGGEKLIG